MNQITRRKRRPSRFRVPPISAPAVYLVLRVIDPTLSGWNTRRCRHCALNRHGSPRRTATEYYGHAASQAQRIPHGQNVRLSGSKGELRQGGRSVRWRARSELIWAGRSSNRPALGPYVRLRRERRQVTAGEVVPLAFSRFASASKRGGCRAHYREDSCRGAFKRLAASSCNRADHPRGHRLVSTCTAFLRQVHPACCTSSRAKRQTLTVTRIVGARRLHIPPVGDHAYQQAGFVAGGLTFRESNRAQPYPTGLAGMICHTRFSHSYRVTFSARQATAGLASRSAASSVPRGPPVTVGTYDSAPRGRGPGDRLQGDPLVQDGVRPQSCGRYLEPSDGPMIRSCDARARPGPARTRTEAARPGRDFKAHRLRPLRVFAVDSIAVLAVVVGPRSASAR